MDLPLGQGDLTMGLPQSVIVLRSRPTPVLADPQQATARAIAAPVGAPPLMELARGRCYCCLVISDITSPVLNRDMLPPILAALEPAGLPLERVTILVATGHAPGGQRLRTDGHAVI